MGNGRDEDVSGKKTEAVCLVGSWVCRVLFSLSRAHLSMQRERGLDDEGDLLLDSLPEVFLDEVVGKNCVVDGEERGLLGEGNAESPEVSLQSGVDDEGPGGRIEAGQVLGVVDVFQLHLGPVVPVLIVHVLAEQSDGGLRVVWIQLGHIQIIQEVNQTQPGRETRAKQRKKEREDERDTGHPDEEEEEAQARE